jgi:hypothetical protein
METAFSSGASGPLIVGKHDDAGAAGRRVTFSACHDRVVIDSASRVAIDSASDELYLE